jgi:23S rRNA pseudouridine1911/1915/1917 synthase
MSKREKQPFQVIHLDASEDGMVLERALKQRLTEWSWGEVREGIRKRRVQVNGNLCLDPLRKVAPKDVIKVWNESLPKPIEASDIRIAYVDEFLVVVEKPAGITSVRHFEERNLSQRRRQLQPTLEELLPMALMEHFQVRIPKEPGGLKKSVASKKKTRDPRANILDQSKSLEAKLKRFAVIAVHRLDRDTSGLMIFARTPSVAQMLGRAFKVHRVVRRYHAVVHGHPAAQTIDTVLVRDRGDGHRGTKPEGRGEDPTEQRAVTHLRPIEKIGPFSMIECQLETGRTHQIRIHLAEAGHLLCGEPIYSRRPDGSTTSDESDAPRQALHSATLAFEHPISGEKLEFKMPWPADLHRWLGQLRAKYGTA